MELTYYFSDDDSDHHFGLGLEKFLAAYELDSCNFMSCLYITHSYHDRGELKNALKYYELVDKEALKKFQIWRTIELEEFSNCDLQISVITFIDCKNV